MITTMLVIRLVSDRARNICRVTLSMYRTCFSDVDPACDYRHPGVICGDATAQERAHLAAQPLRLPADDETEHVFRQRRKRRQFP